MKSYQRNGSVKYKMDSNQKHIEIPGMTIIWLLRKIEVVIVRILVIAKYQFYKNTAISPSSLNVPWAKFSVIGFFAFLIFRDDFTISHNIGDNNTHFGNNRFAEEVSFKPKGNSDSPLRKVASLFEKKDPFAFDPNDNEKDSAIKAYVRQFKDVAIAEKEKYGIPASIKMAQALVESDAGRSSLSTKNKNHFGMKCFSRTCKKGHCTNFGDDSHKDFFRKYNSNWESWRAHSLLIVNGRYKDLLKYGDNYRKWAHGLKDLGYATAKKYDETLILMIEKYNLDALDE